CPFPGGTRQNHLVCWGLGCTSDNPGRCLRPAPEPPLPGTWAVPSALAPPYDRHTRRCGADLATHVSAPVGPHQPAPRTRRARPLRMDFRPLTVHVVADHRGHLAVDSAHCPHRARRAFSPTDRADGSRGRRWRGAHSDISPRDSAATTANPRDRYDAASDRGLEDLRSDPGSDGRWSRIRYRDHECVRVSRDIPIPAARLLRRPTHYLSRRNRRSGCGTPHLAPTV